MPDIPFDEQDDHSTFKEPRFEKPNVFFWLLLPPCMLFVLTLFSLTAVRMGAREAPINTFLDRYGGVVITGEVIVILLIAFIAMATDRRRLTEQRQCESNSEHSRSDESDPD